MKLCFTESGWNDCRYWVETHRDVLDGHNELIRDSLRTPFKGVGKPEPLKYELKGWWSRRITGKHRLVYRVTGAEESQMLVIAACQHHY